MLCFVFFLQSVWENNVTTRTIKAVKTYYSQISVACKHKLIIFSSFVIDLIDIAL